MKKLMPIILIALGSMLIFGGLFLLPKKAPQNQPDEQLAAIRDQHLAAVVAVGHVAHPPARGPQRGGGGHQPLEAVGQAQ